MSKKVLISGYYGFENLGDELILSVITHQLKAMDYAPIVLSENPHLTTHQHNVESLARFDFNHIWGLLPQVEFFLSGGGGLFQDVTGPMSPIYYGGLIELAQWRNCPVAFMGQGIGPLKSIVAKLITGRALHHSQFISVRDVKSQTAVSHLAHKKSELVGDPAWLWVPPEAEENPAVKGLGISLRPWKRLNHESIDYLAILIAQYPLARENGVNLIDCQAGTDIIPLSRLEQKLKAEGITCQWFTGSKAVKGIQQSQVMIGMRFHAVLLAALLGVPTMTISYDPKVEALSAMLKLKNISVKEIHTLGPTAFDDAFGFADSETVETMKHSAEHGFQLLFNWASHLIRL